AALMIALTGKAHAASLGFTVPQRLAHGDPNGNPYFGGGEPSVAFDPSGDGHVYVTAPQGVPAVAGNGQGVAYWASADHGHGFPIIERSDNGGQSFTPCGSILAPGSDASNNYSPESGTLVSKPVIDPATGALYVAFSEPDRAVNPANAPIDHMYIAVAPSGCN